MSSDRHNPLQASRGIVLVKFEFAELYVCVYIKVNKIL